MAALVFSGCFSAHTAAEHDAGLSSDVGVAGFVDAGVEALRPEDFGEAYRRARCRHAARCEGYSGYYPSMIAEWCHPRASVLTNWPDIPRFDGTCEPAWVDYSPELAERCLEAIGSADCHRDYGEAYLVCADVFIRSPLPPDWSCAPHRCPPGELCTIVGSCADFSCPHACRVPIAEGEPCIVMGSPWPDDCDGGLRCVGDGGWYSMGTCERLRGEGEPCDGAAPCADDHWCFGGVCELTTGTRGGPCRFDCRGDDFCILQGDGELRCRAGATIGAPCSERCLRGGPCDPPQCAPGGRCVGGTCVRTVREGQACGADAVCIVSFHCEARRCVPDPVEGEPCLDGVPCARGVCDGGHCRLKEAGEACEILSDTPLGECIGGRLGCDYSTGTCRPAHRQGEPCELDVLTCAPGLVCSYPDHLCQPDDSCWCAGRCPPEG